LKKLMIKKKARILFLAFLVFGVLAVNFFAITPGERRPLCQELDDTAREKEFLKKLSHARECAGSGLSDTQKKKLKKLESTARKELIRRDSEIKTLTVEIETLTWESPLGPESINELMAMRHERQIEKNKYLDDVYAKLDKILSSKQKEA